MTSIANESSAEQPAPRPSGPLRIAYGTDPNQFGDLSVPSGPGPWPVVMIIHGGFWRARYDLSLGAPLAADLTTRGFAVWNVEYRRVGNDGGWPTTLTDVAAAVDHLARIAQDDAQGALRKAQGTGARTQGTRAQAQGTGGQAQDTGGQAQGTGGLDLRRVIAIGHSAGGHLAAWLGGRSRLAAPFGPPIVHLTGIVCQAAVLDLETAGAMRLGDGAVDDFAGGRMTKAADWRVASPMRQLPIAVPVRCVHGDQDDVVPIEQSARYVAAAAMLGSDAALITVPGGDHYGVITPGDPGWAACVRAVEDLVAAT